MLSLALVVALGGLTRASYDSIFGWLTVALNPDLFVSPSQSLTQRDFRFPESMGAQLKRDSGRRRSANGARCAHRDPRQADHVRRRRYRRAAAPRHAAAGGRQYRRDVPAGRARQSGAGFGKLRAAARIQTGRRGGYPEPQRRAASADRRHRDRLFRRARQSAGGSRALQALLERQHGEHLPHLSGARRGGSGREAADSGTVRQSATACSSSPIATCAATFCG